MQAKETQDPKEYAIALDYFTRILPRMTPGGDAYWETWLRIIECKEALKGSAAADEIKKTLQDLKGSTAHLGGDTYKEDFDRLLLKYGCEGEGRVKVQRVKVQKGVEGTLSLAGWGHNDSC